MLLLHCVFLLVESLLQLTIDLLLLFALKSTFLADLNEPAIPSRLNISAWCARRCLLPSMANLSGSSGIGKDSRLTSAPFPIMISPLKFQVKFPSR